MVSSGRSALLSPRMYCALQALRGERLQPALLRGWLADLVTGGQHGPVDLEVPPVLQPHRHRRRPVPGAGVHDVHDPAENPVDPDAVGRGALHDVQDEAQVAPVDRARGVAVRIGVLRGDVGPPLAQRRARACPGRAVVRGTGEHRDLAGGGVHQQPRGLVGAPDPAAADLDVVDQPDLGGGSVGRLRRPVRRAAPAPTARAGRNRPRRSGPARSRPRWRGARGQAVEVRDPVRAADGVRAARSWRSAVWLSIRSRPLEVTAVARSARGDPHRHPACLRPVQSTVGVDRAPRQARVVGVQAVRDVERPGRERPAPARWPTSEESPSTACTRRPGLVQDLRVVDRVPVRQIGVAPGVRRPVGGRGQRGQVLGHGRDAVRLGLGLHDQPLGAAQDRDPRAVGQQRPRPGDPAREHAHVRVEHDVPVDVVRQQLGRQPVQRGERLDVLHRVGLLRVAQRDAAQAVLHEEQRLQHAGGDQQGRWAQLPEQAPAERLQVRPSRRGRPPARRTSRWRPPSGSPTRPAASGRRAGSTTPGRPRWPPGPPRPPRRGSRPGGPTRAGPGPGRPSPAAAATSAVRSGPWETIGNPFSAAPDRSARAAAAWSPTRV